jgi:hypothetical protein
MPWTLRVARSAEGFKMDVAEARRHLVDHLERIASAGYAVLAERIRQDQVHEVLHVAAESGRCYQLEVDIVWDHQPGGAIRLLGGIDDGGLRAFLPLTDSRLIVRA